ncbi:acyl-CoA dehydrogenase family protein [Rhabdothermincola sediminis]|uniref:acyl-CoA dehydrogenase family protein n=1 Tax=Rhabdothermincola sediminis TaxID=2751370 RepID=UPI001AA0AAEE|nr:acyl-CoA dehydrogenase family protein [Rhabdothermincola sediminis]
MDFSLTDEQTTLVELADQILGDRCTLERLKEVGAGERRTDVELWRELARADLVGAALPADVGGGGFGFLEACLLLEQVGRHVAPVPYWATVVLGGLTIAEHGAGALRQELLAGAVAGEVILSAALQEELADPRSPATIARPEGAGWRLNGEKILVPSAPDAAVIVVPARADAGVGLFLVEPGSSGVSLVAEETMGQWPLYRLVFEGVAVEPERVLVTPGGEGQRALERLVDLATVGLCAISAGVCERGLRITAEYASERKQFDRPIATFQAVGQRLADAFIDTEAVRLTMLNAASLLDAGLPASKEVATAKFWASDGASRVAHALLHVHGGISIDVDYPIHRYFLWAKQIENDLGASTVQLQRLGDLIATEP